jgi:RNA polymerase sigma-70 factor (ECF subfamily)
VNDAKTLIERVRSGDASAFERLYDRYARLVFGIALRIVDDESTAEDILQSVLLKFWHSPERYRGGNFTAWLCRATRARAIGVLKKRLAYR